MRRAVLGRTRSFDAILNELKAMNEAKMRAKIDAHGNVLSPIKLSPVLSPAAVAPPLRPVGLHSKPIVTAAAALAAARPVVRTPSTGSNSSSSGGKAFSVVSKPPTSSISTRTVTLSNSPPLPSVARAAQKLASPFGNGFHHHHHSARSSVSKTSARKMLPFTYIPR